MAVRTHLRWTLTAPCWIATGSFLKPTAPPSPRRPAGNRSRALTGPAYDFAMTVAITSDSTLTMIVSNGALIR